MREPVVETVLVSFCNLPFPKGSGVLRVDLASGATNDVKLNCPNGVQSCTGLAKDKNRVYVLITSEGMHYVVALRRHTLEFVFCQAVPEIVAGHSMWVHGGHLYIVSTGTDEVIRYVIAPEGLQRPLVVWQASGTKSDTHHVNSITEWRGDIVVSAFGPKSDMLWSSSKCGYIHNISRDSRIKDDIYHPHSLTVLDENLYYCESHTRTFCSLEGPLFQLDGYARGACWLSREFVCVGSSIGRKYSKSTGQIANPADPGEPSGRCEIVIWQVTRNIVRKKLNLAWFGPEIYDILSLDRSGFVLRMLRRLGI